MPNLYADCTMFARRFLDGNAADVADQDAIERVLEDAARRVDRHTGRTFYASTAARIFDGPGRDPSNQDYLYWAQYTQYTQTRQAAAFLRLPDCLAVTAAALDLDGDRVFETALAAATDYYLLNEAGDDQDAAPFDRFQLDQTQGTYRTFSARPRLLRLSGRWGYSETTEPDQVGATATTATLADTTTRAMTTNQAGQLARGQTLLLGAEAVYVADGAGQSWTVLRAQNGTTAAAHASTAVLRYVYVPQVREACLLQAGRLWQRRRTAYSSIVSLPGGAGMQVYKDLDPDFAIDLFALTRRYV